MSAVSGLNVPEELKARIKQAAREREQDPASLIASALDLLQEAEALQVEEVRRRLDSRPGKPIANKQVMAWLDTWGLEQETPPPQCE